MNTKQVKYFELCPCNPANGGSGVCGCIIGDKLVDTNQNYTVNTTTTTNIDFNTPTKETIEQQTAVEFLAEKYNYITWLRNRDEIGPEVADKMREKYLNMALDLFKTQIIEGYNKGEFNQGCNESGEEYYNQTYNN